MRDAILFEFYEKANSQRGYTNILMMLIHRWDHGRKAFKVGPNMWYQPSKEDFYFITELSRRVEDFPHFPNLLSSVASKSELAYVQIYVNVNIIVCDDF